ncbi:MAG TPA: CheR family methyltransferase, partial [Telluria sp.]
MEDIIQVQSDSVTFPVVGIGASAGGYAALMTLLHNMPSSPGMALVVILHLASNEPSAAERLLQSACAMPVVQVTHTMPILPDHVYVIPPDRSLGMRDGHLVLDWLDRNGAHLVAIDLFMRTLAQALAEQAIGVVLSGMGSDGTAGLASIKEMGGVTIAQLPSEAGQGGMPRSAIEAGMADFVLTAGEIPNKLLELRDMSHAIRRQAWRARRIEPSSDLAPQRATLHEVLALLRERTGHDFVHYKPANLMRQLERRMQVRCMPDLRSYCYLLQKDASEASALLKDLLIGVTSFYRDPDAFAALGRLALPQLLKPGGQPMRAWVAACSTGEEAYTLAMLLADQAAQAGDGCGWQIFASDIDEHAVQVARAGLYPDTIVGNVPVPQLERYFTREAERYKVRRSLRERILFAQHNLLHAPAFSRLDLISCRNFMIYLDQEMQRQLLQHFHFALNPQGCLMLGSTESVDAATDLFEPVDAARRIFRARPQARLARPPRPASRVPAAAPVLSGTRPAGQGAGEVAAASTTRRRGRLFSFAEIHQHKTAELAPPNILLDANADIVHVSEQALRFLRQAAGEPTRELAALVLPGLQLALRAALFQVQKNGRPASTGPVRLEGDDGPRLVDMELLPFQDPHAEGELILVRFMLQAAPDQSAPLAPHAPSGDNSLLHQVEEELRHTRKRLRDTLEQAETAGGEMRIYAEEMQAMVDELRANAAELEYSRAELLASRQELALENLEWQRRAEDSAKAHDDLVNLVASSDVATIFLDRDMRIQRYTPRIADLFNVIPADIGRPLLHITNRLDAPRLAEEAAKVFLTLQAMEREVRSKDGRDYIVRVHPYRTARHRIEGAVMTFFDITGHRAAEQALRASEERFRLFVTASSDILYRMSADWSEMLSLQGKHFLVDTDNPSRTWVDTYIPEEDRPQVNAAIEAAIAGKTIFELEHRVQRSEGGIRWTFSRAI